LSRTRNEIFFSSPIRDLGRPGSDCLAAELLFQISPTNLTAINSMVPDVHDLPEKSTVAAASQYLIKSHCPLNAVHGFPPFGKYRKVTTSFVTRRRYAVLSSLRPVFIELLRRFERIREGLGRGTHMALRRRIRGSRLDACL
jgi:hypothetical protein